LAESVNGSIAAGKRTFMKIHKRAITGVALAFFATALATGQQTAPARQLQPESKAPAARITPEQAKQLFSLVDQLIKFSSNETGLPIKSEVKRQLTTRAEVESYLTGKFNDDQDSKRMQRDEIVLKKFGLLDRDFSLKPFLLALLKEQIEAYYDSKTKTVNMLDWVDVDEQKPVLAHELTHALQDQHSDLDKWDNQTPDDVSVDAAGDADHLTRDEMDTARDAVAEGQATAVMMDYILKPMGKTLVKNPEVIHALKDQMAGGSDSPIMSRAPLLLSESMLFPYREGLSFEQDLWMDQGQTAAFSGALDHPPTSTWEIINPRVYEAHKTPVVPLLPNIHPLVDKLYVPYDIGQVGQLDVHIMAELFGGDEAAQDLTPAWNGGIYWAGQLRSAASAADPAAANRAGTKSLAMFYMSVWRNPATAQAFAKLYANSLGRKYSGLKEDEAAEASSTNEAGSIEQVYSTNEGPVTITTRGSMVFVAESFPLDLARSLASLILGAQGTGEMKMADAAGAGGERPAAGLEARQGEPLTAGLVRFIGDCGVMKAVVDAGLNSASKSAAASH
jgi:hypothetical protein